MIEVEKVRRETPGCEEVIHFNNAGASLMPRPVLHTVVQHLQREALIGGYEAKEEADDRLEQVYQDIAAFIGARPQEIAIIENATRAFDMAFHALPLSAGDVILTTTTEYGSNYLAYLLVQQTRGVEVRCIPNAPSGQISLDGLRKMIDDRTRLISFAHIPTNSGLIQPAEAVGRIAREAGLFFLLDATQSVGQYPIDVSRIGCHILATTSRKYLRGPRGVGFLYVSEAILDRLIPPFIDLHAASLTSATTYAWREDARKFENWESSIANTLGLGAAVRYATHLGIEAIWKRVHALAASLRSALQTVPGVRIYDRGEVQGGLVSFTMAGLEPEEIKSRLREQRINVSTSSRAGTWLDMEEKGVRAVVRASVHYYNTEEEIQQFIAALERLRKRG
ncbi:MAG: aminotransferase class V-fold PLP-dependent enzyme [Nitrospinota bacterium]|nr:MAG: aminotransferase class V-fold PLP-dependent enzyme [Nitrospinota bacterium]